jgi:CHAD domain-containing protein
MSIPSEDLSSSGPPESRDTAEVVQGAIAGAVDKFFENVDKAAKGKVRGVHQSRVGLRTLRSHLRTFRRVIDTEWASALSAEASWLAESLGSIRDLDVLNLRLIEGAMLQVPEHAPEVAGLVTLLEEQRTEALDRFREVGETARYEGLVVRLKEAATAMPSRGSGVEPAEWLLPYLLQRTWRELRDAARTARNEPTIENLHTVRIRSKRMRYACEASTAVLGADAEITAKASEALQERLGEWHDACAAQDWLERAADKNPNLSQVADRLVEFEVRAAEEAANSWVSEFRDVKRSWKKLDPGRRKKSSTA